MTLRSLALAALAVTALLPVDMASAQTVRRHLHCRLEAGPTIPNPLVTIATDKLVIAINNWSFAIPRGTKFTYRIGNSSSTKTFTSTASLAPGATLIVGSSKTGSTCDVTIPG